MNESGDRKSLSEWQAARDHFWPHAQPAGDVSESHGLNVIERGEGVWLWDMQGRRFFDVLSGIFMVNVGHGRHEIAEALSLQARNLAYAPYHSVSPVTARASARLVELTGHAHGRVYWTNGGTEAAETAMKISRQFHRMLGRPQRVKFVGRKGSYHGCSFMTMSVSRSEMSNVSMFEPLPGNTLQCAQPMSFRCPFSCAPRCSLRCAEDLEAVFLREGPETIAAFIAEPVSVAAGTYFPHIEYWDSIQKICRKYGVLLIVDEVITGFGRTGKVMASEHWGIVSDMTLAAKGLSSGYSPAGAVIVSKAVSDAFLGGESRAFRQGISTGGNPVSSAAVMANLDILEKENLSQNAQAMGAYLLKSLERLKAFEIVGDVRGMGLLCAIEFVANRDTFERLPVSFGLKRRLNQLFRQNELWGRTGDVTAIAPPLCVRQEEVDWLVERIERSVRALNDDYLRGVSSAD